VLQAKDDAEDVGIEHRAVCFHGNVGQRPQLALCASVVDGDVKPIEARYRSVDEITYVFLMPNICEDELGLRAEPSQLGLQRFPFRFLATRDN
jgi:hypothetical protein